MSRIGKKPIKVPKDVDVSINNNSIVVKGAKGQLEYDFQDFLKVSIVNDCIEIARSSDIKEHKAMHGTTRQLINNMIIGVSEGFTKELEIIGVGYQAQVQGKRLLLQLGFSHDIFFDMPKDITVTADRTQIKVEGPDKQLVGAVAAKIRSFRPPEPYKGKGVRYKNEYVRSKQGKTVGAK